MDLKAILDYQKIDIKVYKCEKEYAQSKELEVANRCKKAFEERKKALVALGSELDAAINQFSKLEAKLSELSENKVNKFSAEEITDEATLSSFEKDFASYEEEISALSKEINALIKKINDINFSNKTLNEEMNAFNKEFQTAAASLKVKEEKIKETIKPLLKQLKEIKPLIEEKLIKKYEELRKAKRMPAFIPYQPAGNVINCGACGMDITVEVAKKLLQSGDVAECPHCGRVVYRP